MPFIVPQVCRFAVEGTVSGRPAVNILDMQIDTTGSIESRADAISDQAGVILNEWSDHVLNWACSTYVAERVSWTDLDSDEGSVGQRTSTDQETWPQPGVETQPAVPPNASMLVTKEITSGRTRRNGRMFLVGIPEPQTEPGDPAIMTAAFVAARQDDMASFLGNVNQSEGSEITYSSQLVVTHVLTRGPSPGGGRPGPPLTGDFRDVDALTVQRRLATQRRRLRK